MSNTKWEPDRYNEVADFVAKLGEPLIALLAPQLEDYILDLGCGDGKLSRKIQPLCAKLTGIDASEEMVAAANENGIDAHVADAHALTFEQAFDAVISNAALHWMLEPEAVLSSIHRALVPGGRFVAEFGGSGNAGKIVDVLKQALDTRNIPFTHPWYFPTAVEYAKLLEKHGFSIKYMNMFERLTPLPQPLSEWVLTFCQSFLSQASEKQKKEICEELHEALAPELFINGQWHVDYMRLRLKAIKL